MKKNSFKENYIPPEINWIRLEGKGEIGLTAYPGKNMISDSKSLDNDLRFIRNLQFFFLRLCITRN